MRLTRGNLGAASTVSEVHSSNACSAWASVHPTHLSAAIICSRLRPNLTQSRTKKRSPEKSGIVFPIGSGTLESAPLPYVDAGIPYPAERQKEGRRP